MHLPLTSLKFGVMAIKIIADNSKGMQCFANEAEIYTIFRLAGIIAKVQSFFFI
jgi:hypothetical protein